MLRCTGRFSMVCRDAHTHKARAVNPLVLNSDAERALHAIGQEYRNRRQSSALRSLSRVPPTNAEVATLHQLQLEYGADHVILQAGEERVWMGDTKLEISQIMFPQQRKYVPSLASTNSS
jgi:acyl-coenzyme A thioesterase 9